MADAFVDLFLLPAKIFGLTLDVSPFFAYMVYGCKYSLLSGAPIMAKVLSRTCSNDKLVVHNYKDGGLVQVNMDPHSPGDIYNDNYRHLSSLPENTMGERDRGMQHRAPYGKDEGMVKYPPPTKDYKPDLQRDYERRRKM